MQSLRGRSLQAIIDLMPSKNRLKIYVNDGFYHIYNRGVAKENIFNDIQDYKVFLKYLKQALTKSKIQKIDFSLRRRSFEAVPRLPKNFIEEIDLIAYCLMPNHFHFLLRQKNQNSMESFMRSVITRYAQFFNKKYDRVGPVFQGRYKAILITQDNYLLHLTRYIHLNPAEFTNDLIKTYSSYADYLGLRRTTWIKPDTILKFFDNKTIPEIIKINSYKDFIENYKKDSKQVLGELALE